MSTSQNGQVAQVQKSHLTLQKSPRPHITEKLTVPRPFFRVTYVQKDPTFNLRNRKKPNN